MIIKIKNTKKKSFLFLKRRLGLLVKLKRRLYVRTAVATLLF